MHGRAKGDTDDVNMTLTITSSTASKEATGVQKFILWMQTKSLKQSAKETFSSIKILLQLYMYIQHNDKHSDEHRTPECLHANESATLVKPGQPLVPMNK